MAPGLCVQLVDRTGCRALAGARHDDTHNNQKHTMTRTLSPRSPRWPALAAALLAGTFLAGAAHADATLDKIRQRGKIVVGVMLSGSAFGSIDPATQKPVGFNADLAQDLAKQLNVELETVQVQPSNRVQFLQQGKVDVLIASMEYTPERGEQLGYVPTPYYRVGGAVIVPKQSDIKRWEDLKGKTVCISQGSSYTRPVQVEYGAIPKGFKGSSESLLALRGDNCAGAVHDNTLLQPLVRGNPEWQNYRIVLPELNPAPTVIWTRKGEQDTIQAVERVVQGWHRSGWLIGTEKKNGILPPSPSLTELHDKFKGGRG